MAEIETIISIALGVVAIATVGYSVAKGQFSAEKKQSEKYQNLSNDVNALSIKVGVIWKIFEEQLPKLLVRPTHIEMDELIEKYVAHEATKEEMMLLSNLMEKELEEGTDPVTKLKISFIKPVLDHNISKAKK